jgi:hypothetical protein
MNPKQPRLNPEWCTDEVAEAIFGINRTRMHFLRKEGLIRYKRLPLRGDGTGLRMRVLNNCQSIREWLESLPDADESPQTEAGELAATTQNQEP